jgi:BirA family biotin operon repressor/biotin-[acetyl-CoA-carboxylase] ligase
MSEQGPEPPSPSAEGAAEPPKRVNPRQPEPVGPDTIERFGRPMRIFPVAVSTDVMAQAWANKESAPHGAAVIVEHEINPRGLHGALWQTPPSDTLAVAVVLRPTVSPEEGDVTWLVGALAGLDAIEAVSKTAFAAWWPDAIVETETNDPVAAAKSEVQLGPGQIKNAVVTVRFDLLRLDLDPEKDRDPLCEAFVHAVDRVTEELAEHGSSRVATAYGERCTMLGKRVKVRLRPKGETRGVARRVDRAARLEVESLSGMVERIGVNQLMELEVVERPASAGSPG